ncbi:MAG: CPBP family intramembrane metalloprotease [Bacteroidetes bacterium]|nr:CPBP family intramembrane metalloprotease [Bacteroidota bacterium]
MHKLFLVYFFPPILIILNYFVFNFLTSLFDVKEGYLAGRFSYWIFFCIIPVKLWISKKNLALLFKVKKMNWWQMILIILPVVFAFKNNTFKTGIEEAAPMTIVLMLLFAVVNAFCEEYLWRGLYFNYHQTNIFFSVIVPSVWFAVWHYVPLSIYPPGMGNFYFILSVFGMGLCWGIVTFYTRSVFWNIISHTLVDIAGIGWYISII